MFKAEKLLTFLIVLLIINYHHTYSRRFFRGKFYSNHKVYHNPLNRPNIIHQHIKVYPHAYYKPHLKLGLSSNYHFKNALIGGLIGASAGVLIGHAITYDNRKYYFNKEYIKIESDKQMCQMSLKNLLALQNNKTNSTENIKKLNLTNNQPKYVYWNCKRLTEICCNTSCCLKPIIKTKHNEEQKDLTVLVISIASILFILFICFCIILWEFFIDFVCCPFDSEIVYYENNPEYACYDQTIVHQPQIYPSMPYPQNNQIFTVYPPAPEYHIFPPVYTK